MTPRERLIRDLTRLAETEHCVSTSVGAPGCDVRQRAADAEASLREAIAELRTAAAVRQALFQCAAHCQGGHSAAGAAAADVLGVGFPILMPELVQRAFDEGLTPLEVWPWLPERNEAGRLARRLG